MSLHVLAPRAAADWRNAARLHVCSPRHPSRSHPGHGISTMTDSRRPTTDELVNTMHGWLPGTPLLRAARRPCLQSRIYLQVRHSNLPHPRFLPPVPLEPLVLHADTTPPYPHPPTCRAKCGVRCRTPCISTSRPLGPIPLPRSARSHLGPRCMWAWHVGRACRASETAARVVVQSATPRGRRDISLAARAPSVDARSEGLFFSYTFSPFPHVLIRPSHPSYRIVT
jgi:hypothetical protein